MPCPVCHPPKKTVAPDLLAMPAREAERLPQHKGCVYASAGKHSLTARYAHLALSRPKSFISLRA